MRIDLVSEFYNSRSINANSQKLINLFPEMDASGKNPVAFYGTPGSTTVATPLPDFEVRGCIEYNGISYWVSGNKFYSVTTGYISTLYGQLTTSSGYVSMTTDGLVIFMVDGENGYVYTIADNSFQTVIDADFPANPCRCDQLDNLFLVVEAQSQRFWTSANGISWDAADFASAETTPDNLLGVIIDGQEVILGGVKTIENWYNAGGDTFAFARRGIVKRGIAGTAAMCNADNTVFFLGDDGVAYRLGSAVAIRISTHSEEYFFGLMTDISDCRMWTQREEGHEFVWFQFPTGDMTFVYDVASQKWHQRAWRDPNTGILHRHRANCHVFFNNKHLIGDYVDGTIKQLSLDVYDDDGDALASTIVSRHVAEPDLKQVRHVSMQIDMEPGVGLNSGQGSDPQMMLKWSNDGGHVFGSEIWRNMGAVGQYRARAEWDGLGIARDRVYYASITDPVKRVILGAVLDIRVGTS